jgi:peptide-methionine (R)-S-oxide reductase
MRTVTLCLPVVLALITSCAEPSPPAAPLAAAAPSPSPAIAAATGATPMPAPGDKVVRSEAEWRRILTPEQFRVMREKGTERAFTGRYWDTTTPGTYKCAACGTPIFRSDAKFESGCGWPSFFEPLDGARLTETKDTSFGTTRTEITCARCGAHLGHVFDDGPPPTGLRYCINSVSIDLEPSPGAAKPAK